MPGSERAVIVGTAGHVDHGKSALVRALTGTDPDRLREEKARGLTIDLGFAWMTMPSGVTASFVDVPGHEDFIRNMLAGAGAVDAVVFVVAADEGPMPQTHEHLAIIDLLGLSHGVIAVTKTDLVEPDWLALVVEEVADLVAGTSLEGAPVVAISSVSGDGIDALADAIDGQLGVVPPAADHGRPRLSVDRAFTLSGFGTVVTGTLRDGVLRVGEDVVLLPSGIETRVRGLQSLGAQVDAAPPGTRTAVNLTGVAKEDVQRGDTLARPDDYRATQLFDAEIELLDDTPVALAHDAEVHVFHGAAEVPGHVRVIGRRDIAPGASGPVQLRLNRPVVLAARDRFVLRQPSPAQTIGGGVVLDPHPPGRRRRLRSDTLDHFAALSSGGPDDVAYAMVSELQPCAPERLRPEETGLAPDERDAALSRLEADGRIHRVGPLLMTDSGWSSLRARAEASLVAYHETHPLRSGMPSEELRERLGVPPDTYAAVLDEAARQGWLARRGSDVALAAHDVAFTEAQQTAVDALLRRFREHPYTPPSAKEASADAGQDIVAALIARGDLVATAGGDVLFDAEAYDAMVAGVLAHLDAHGEITVADVRDRFATSRKYALALLEHLDRERVTRRVGDIRVRAGSAPQGGT